MITTLLEMCFAVPDVGMTINTKELETDNIKILFSEKPGVLIQVENTDRVSAELSSRQIKYHIIGEVTDRRTLHVNDLTFNIDDLRHIWYKTSYLLDSKQRPQTFAAERYKNYSKQILTYTFPDKFDGRFETYGIDPHRRQPSGLKATIIREKGVNGDREMAYSLYLAGFDVKDVHMTDLVSGREDLSDVNLIVFVGGFSNSDVLALQKGWAGAFLFNPKAKQALDKFYERNDTLSLGVCNGCQLMMELGLVYRDWKDHPKMHHNRSGKFESIFVNVTIPQNNSVMLQSMAGTQLGVWVAHGEGRFELPSDSSLYRIAATYTYKEYPGTPSGSDHSVAALCSKDGRHLAIMPHIERSLFPWNWGYYPYGRKGDQISPWIEAFVNSREWVKNKSGKF